MLFLIIARGVELFGMLISLDLTRYLNIYKY